MTTIIISFTAIILYCVTGFLLAYSLYKRGDIPLPEAA